MKVELQRRCEMFIANRDIIKAEFGWETAYIYPLCAGLFTAKNATADPQALRACHRLLKENTGIFSNFRGVSKMAMVTSLALSANPQEKMERLLFVYNKLKQLFWSSEYLVVAASAITDLAEPSQYEAIVERTRMVYNHMKQAHPFLTSGEDSAFAALLALSGFDDVQIGDEMERCFAILKPEFWSGNAVQSLSHVLALGSDPAETKCDRVTQLYRLLKERGCKYGTGYELPTLGTLALTGASIDALTHDMIEVDDYLKTQKGFGAFGIGAKQRLMYAGMLVMCDAIPVAQTMEVAALNGVVALVIAQQAAICAAMAASSAAAASSGSN